LLPGPYRVLGAALPAMGVFVFDAGSAVATAPHDWRKILIFCTRESSIMLRVVLRVLCCVLCCVCYVACCCVSMLRESWLTPKALANFSPGFEPGLARTLGCIPKNSFNPERVPSRMPNAFSVNIFFLILSPGLSRRSNRWAEISQRLRR